MLFKPGDRVISCFGVLHEVIKVTELGGGELVRTRREANGKEFGFERHRLCLATEKEIKEKTGA